MAASFIIEGHMQPYGRRLCTVVLNHIGFTTDTIVQVNHLRRRTCTPVFRFESHADHIPCLLR